MSIKSIDSLLRYLRDKKGIDISGSAQKRKLQNLGYYHAYKGYRFFRVSSKVLPYTDFDQLVSVYNFDMKLKALFYPQLMFIETALKNRALQEILNNSKSERFNDIFHQTLNDYKSYPITDSRYNEELKKRLNLRTKIYSDLARNFNKKQMVRHFYEKDMPVPIWAIFEQISLGEFAEFIHCLNLSTRSNFSRSVGLHQSYDSDGRLIEKFTYLFRDLRNAVAHNEPIFDIRFSRGKIDTRLTNYLMSITNISSINFTTIADYVILVSYFLKSLGISKTENRRFISDFVNLYETLKKEVPTSIYSIIIHTDTRTKINNLLKFL